MLYVLFMILLSSLFFVLSPHTKKPTQSTNHTMPNRHYHRPHSCITTHHLPSSSSLSTMMPGGDSQRQSLPTRTRCSSRSIPSSKIVANEHEHQRRCCLSAAAANGNGNNNINNNNCKSCCGGGGVSIDGGCGGSNVGCGNGSSGCVDGGDDNINIDGGGDINNGGNSDGADEV